MISTRSLGLTVGLAVAALVVAVAVVLVSAPRYARAAIPAVSGPCVAGWREMSVPNDVFISTPFEVITRNGKQAWILGGTNEGLLALKWNGTTWKQRAGGTSGHRGLVGGVATGNDKVLAVGYYRPNIGNGNGALKPISGRVISSNWRGRSVPDPPGPRATLTDVVDLPGGKAWAVGTRLENGKLRAYAAKWNGSRWNRNEPFAGSGSGLLAVEKTPSGTVWAVGWKEAGLGRPRPYIVKRTNSDWKKIKAAAVQAGPAVLTDVSFRYGRDGYAVGYSSPHGTDQHTVVLQHWDGERWSLVDLPWADDFAAVPRSISVAGPGELWIAGTKTAIDKREARGFIAHLKDGSWDIDVLDTPVGVRSEVMDIAATSYGAVAAANVGASLLVLQSCGDGSFATADATKGNKVRISNMKARREARDEVHIRETPGAADPATGAFSVAGQDDGTFTIAAPVKPKGFKVINKASSSGLYQWTTTYDGFVADFDGNGRLDVFYSRHGTIKPRLAMNSAAGFYNASTAAFSAIDRHGCDRADADNDGDKDIICAVGASRGKAIKRHELSLSPNKAGRQFVRGGLGISDPLGRGRFAAFIKLDDNAYPEVFIANAPDRNDGMPGYNRFYRNERGTFVPEPSMGLDSSHGAECLKVADFDQDGDEDLVYCTQYGFSGRAAGLRFMRNERGQLKDRTGRLGIKPIGDIDFAFADVTGDGRRDLIQLSTTKLRVSRWTSSGYRKIYEAKISRSWAVAAGDASGDGKADIYVQRGSDSANKPDRLLVSKNGGRNYTSVKIPQTAKGSADDVFAFDYDKNGRVDFVVLNGRKGAGPVQLLASYPN
jgi:hypothetical protein